MNTSHAWRALVLVIAFGSAPIAAADWAADEAEMRQRLADSALAFNRGDLPGHLAVYDESVTFMTKDGPRPGVAPIEKAFREKYFRDGRPSSSCASRARVRRCARRRARDRALGALGRRQPEQSGWFTLAWSDAGMAGGARPFELSDNPATGPMSTSSRSSRSRLTCTPS